MREFLEEFILVIFGFFGIYGIFGILSLGADRPSKITLINKEGIHSRTFRSKFSISWEVVTKVVVCPSTIDGKREVVVYLKTAAPITFQYKGSEAALQEQLENTMPKNFEMVPYNDGQR